tara:strand:- start:928 stop:1602 length:675 start_codon:yes stop_codon:yes gene_type:complete
MKIHVITYATHSEGMFKELINNKFNIKVKVLGWRTKWNGFMDKFKTMYEYIQTLPKNDIIIFIDGFDSKINQPIDIIKKNFLEFDSDIVISLHPNLLGNYLNKKIFGTCKGNLIANSGLYMGYNIKIQELLNNILNNNYSRDDQTSLNSACKYFSNIKLDINKKLFNNLNYLDRYINNKSEACFISKPGDLTLNRLKRVPEEYIPFIWKELLFIILIIIIMYYI